jgi:acyl-CoA hydrolase
VGATEGNDFVSKVSRSLNEPIENFGVSGDTTRDGLARVDEAVARHPSVAIILLGGNDYLRRIPQEETFENLRTIVEKFQTDGALTVVLGVRGGLLSDNYADDYARLAKDTNSVYVSDVLKNLLGNKQFMSDQIHPNDAGYAIIAERVFAAVRPVVK